MLDDSNISKLYKEICSLHGLKQAIKSLLITIAPFKNMRVKNNTSELMMKFVRLSEIRDQLFKNIKTSRLHTDGVNLVSEKQTSNDD